MKKTVMFLFWLLGHSSLHCIDIVSFLRSNFLVNLYRNSQVQ